MKRYPPNKAVIKFVGCLLLAGLMPAEKAYAQEIGDSLSIDLLDISCMRNLVNVQNQFKATNDQLTALEILEKFYNGSCKGASNTVREAYLRVMNAYRNLDNVGEAPSSSGGGTDADPDCSVCTDVPSGSEPPIILDEAAVALIYLGLQVVADSLGSWTNSTNELVDVIKKLVEPRKIDPPPPDTLVIDLNFNLRLPPDNPDNPDNPAPLATGPTPFCKRHSRGCLVAGAVGIAGIATLAAVLIETRDSGLGTPPDFPAPPSPTNQ